jgi:light-regulated signal transduction histidine kinase (bacteriophytochrome)
MNKLIEALLDFARLGRRAVRKENVNMDKMVNELVTTLLREGKTSPEITIGPLGIAWADYQLIRQVWYNLLSNAIKFSAGKENARIEIGRQPGEKEYGYYVRDNGVGFDPAYAGELFGVFKRLHSLESFPGTGAGLAICHRIVTSHGGSISGSATEGEGATFVFTLPRQVAEQTSSGTFVAGS